MANLSMYLLLIFQFLKMALCRETGGAFFGSNNSTDVYDEEILLTIPDLSMVSCLLQCRSHDDCVEVAMSVTGDCLLLRETVTISVNATLQMATRISPPLKADGMGVLLLA